MQGMWGGERKQGQEVKKQYKGRMWELKQMKESVSREVVFIKKGGEKVKVFEESCMGLVLNAAEWINKLNVNKKSLGLCIA